MTNPAIRAVDAEALAPAKASNQARSWTGMRRVVDVIFRS
jgi:hypothetical protein